MIRQIKKMNNNLEVGMSSSLESNDRPPAVENTVLYALGDPSDPESAEFIIDLIDSYLEDSPPLLKEISTAIEEKDFESLEHNAHTFKSICYSLGAMQLGNISKDLEVIGRANQKAQLLPPEALSLVGQAKAEYERVKVGLAIERQKCLS